MRSSSCDVHVLVRYNDEDDCVGEERTFAISETRRSGIRFAVQVTLVNGNEILLNLGQFPNQDIRFSLYRRNVDGGWLLTDNLDINTKCVNMFDAEDGSESAAVVSGAGGAWDIATGHRGRMMTVWGQRRAGANSGLVSVDPVSGEEVPVVSGDVVLRVAYLRWGDAGGSERFLIRQNRGSPTFSKSIVLEDGEEKWVNLGQFPQRTLEFELLHYDASKGWLSSSKVTISTARVEEYPPAQQLTGYPIPNARHTGSSPRFETITGYDRLCDGSVAYRIFYCEDEHIAPLSRTFVIKEDRRSNVDFAVAVEVPNCHETVVVVPADEIPSNQDLIFRLYTPDGQGGYSLIRRVRPLLSRRTIEAGVCPGDLSPPATDGDGRRALRATGMATGSSIRTSASGISGIGVSTRIVLPSLGGVDPSALGAEASSAARAAVDASGDATDGQMEAVRVGAQAALRALLQSEDPALAAQVRLFVNADA